MDTLEIIGKEQYDQINVGVPEALIKIISQIDQINGKNLSLKGLNESVISAKELQAQLGSIYATITEEQQKAALSIQRLAKANKDNADAALKNAKAQQLQTKAAQSNAKANKSVGDELIRNKLIITNDTQAINENTKATIGNTAVTLEDAEAHAISNAATARQTPTLAANTVAQETNTIATAEATIAQKAQNEALQESASASGGLTNATKGLRSFWSGLRQIAYILPGIGIAGIFNLAIVGIVKFGEYILGAKKNVDLLADTEAKAAKNRERDLKNATKAQKDFSDQIQKSTESATESYAKEKSQLDILYGSATDVNLSMSDRLKAIKNLQDLYPAYFANLTNEQILTGNAKSAYDELNGALVKRISLNVYQDELELLIKQNREITNQRDLFEETQRKLAKGIGGDSSEELLNGEDRSKKINDYAALQVENSNKQKKVLLEIFGLEKDLSKLLVDRSKVRKKAETDQSNEIDAAQKRLNDTQRDAKVEELNRTVTINKSILDDENRTTQERLDAYYAYYAARNEIALINLNKERADIENWLQLYQGDVDKANATEKSKRTEHQNALLIDYQEHLERELKITQKYAADISDIGVDAANDLQKTLLKDPLADKDFISSIQRGNSKLYSDLDKKRKDDLKKEKQAAKEREDILRASLDIIYAIGDAASYQTQQQLAGLDAQSEKLKSNLQTEIDAINASADSEEEKQKKIQDAQGRTAAAQAVIDKQERDAKIRQARLDKAITIAQIILNTAMAVSKALPSIPLAIAAGIAGATQLAIAVATPIPQYMKGTDYHKGGLAMVGDGGEPELIREPNKNPYWSPSTDTIMNLAKGTSVTPLSDFTNYGLLYGASALNGGSKASPSDINMLRKDINALGGIMKDKKEVNINIDRHGMRILEKQANARTIYLGRKYNG